MAIHVSTFVATSERRDCVAAACEELHGLDLQYIIPHSHVMLSDICYHLCITFECSITNTYTMHVDTAMMNTAGNTLALWYGVAIKLYSYAVFNWLGADTQWHWIHWHTCEYIHSCSAYKRTTAANAHTTTALRPARNHQRITPQSSLTKRA